MANKTQWNSYFQLLENIEVGMKTLGQLKRERKAAMRQVLADILILENFIEAHPDILTLLKRISAPEVNHVELRRVLLIRLTIDPFALTHAFSEFDMDRFVKFQLPPKEYENVAQTRSVDFDLAF